MRDWFWNLLGKDPEAAIVYFASGEESRVRAMYEEIRALEPSREHIVVCRKNALEGLPCVVWNGGPLRLGRKRIGLAPFLLGDTPDPLRTLAYRTAPHRLLAFNERGERHHLRLTLASLLFWRGVPLDRIWLRPWWWPWTREQSRPARESQTWEGRPLRGLPRVGIVAPYFPWPLGHGGAVRIYSLLREAAKEYDLYYYCFAEAGTQPGPVMDLVHRAVLFEMPRYREPRWASLEPPEVREFRSGAMAERIARDGLSLVQAEYTHLAPYAKGAVVAHDVTYDLYQQIHRRRRTWGSWWDFWRWKRYESGIQGKVIVMAEKDAPLVQDPVIVPNGVDLERFTPSPDPDEARVLFIGSFRHFPNVTAYRFLREEIWPLVRAAMPQAGLEVVAGPDFETYHPAAGEPGVVIQGFVADVVPLYRRASVVVSPTLVSAGTNLKVLEAMAMRRAVVSTPSGCGGLNLAHGESVWIAETASALADGIVTLLRDAALRQSLADSARRVAERDFDWRAIGAKQAALWRELLG